MKKILLAIVLILIVFFVLIETGTVKSNRYTYLNTHTISFNQKSKTNRMVQTLKDTALLNNKNENNANKKPSPHSIILLYKGDTLYRDSTIEKPFIVKINKLDIGSLWMPLSKSADYTVIGTSFSSHKTTTTSANQIITEETKYEGKLTLKGKIKIDGICSHYQAQKLVKGLIIHQIVDEIKQRLSTASKEIVEAPILEKLAF